MSWQSLTTDQNYWQKIVGPLADKNNLYWDVHLDYIRQTLTITLLHKLDTNGHNGIHHSTFLSKIDGDREKRTERTILNEIRREVAKRIIGK